MVTRLIYYNEWADVLVVVEGGIEVWHTNSPREIRFYEYEGKPFIDTLKENGYRKMDYTADAMVGEIGKALMQMEW